MKRKPVTGGLIAATVLLVVLGVVPWLAIMGPAPFWFALIPVAVGSAVNFGLAALLYFLRRTWVGILVALRSLLGGAYDVWIMFDYRRMAGEWAFHEPGLLIVTAAAFMNLLIVVTIFTRSTQKALASASDFVYVVEDDDD